MVLSYIPILPIFRPSQRDTSGRVIIESNVVDPLDHNVSKWRECAGDKTFKDTGKLEYGCEIGRMVASDGYTCGGKKEEIDTCTASLVMDLLFKHVGPDLLKENCISELIGRAYTWMLVPGLESNNKWLTKGIQDYFERRGAKVVLSDCGAGSTRQHSV